MLIIANQSLALNKSYCLLHLWKLSVFLNFQFSWSLAIIVLMTPLASIKKKKKYIFECLIHVTSAGCRWINGSDVVELLSWKDRKCFLVNQDLSVSDGVKWACSVFHLILTVYMKKLCFYRSPFLWLYLVTVRTCFYQVQVLWSLEATCIILNAECTLVSFP